ncbi:MAG: hypothetical protein JNL74_13540 [Fibrobacteres bacterium]|nr:hypothetical protein [Fibrobacterota bacterium]
MAEKASLKETIVESFSPLYPSPVVSLFLFGKSAIDPEGKDLPPTVGIVLEKSSISEIRLVKDVVEKLVKKGASFPFVFTREFVETSLDSFPLEFLEFQSYHSMLLGESPFSKRTPDVRHVRLHCEREIKGKSLHLKSAILNLKDPKKLRDVLFVSREDLSRISIGLLVLKGTNPPAMPDDVIPEMARLYGVDRSLVMKIVKGDVALSETEAVFESYVTMLDNLSINIE